MRQTVGMIFIMMILSTLTACPQEEIVGRWESEGMGLGSVLEIKPDGDLVSSLIVRVEKYYRIKGNTVIFSRQDMTGEIKQTPKQTDTIENYVTPDNKSDESNSELNQKSSKQVEQSEMMGQFNKPVTYEFVLDGDSLKMTHETGYVMDMRRRGQIISPDSIVGEWSYIHENGQRAYVSFDEHGIWLYRLVLPGAADKKYVIKGDTITVYGNVKDNKKPEQTATFQLTNGNLVLTFNDGKKDITHHYTPYVELP